MRLERGMMRPFESAFDSIGGNGSRKKDENAQQQFPVSNNLDDGNSECNALKEELEVSFIQESDRVLWNVGNDTYVLFLPTPEDNHHTLRLNDYDIPLSPTEGRVFRASVINNGMVPYYSLLQDSEGTLLPHEIDYDTRAITAAITSTNKKYREITGREGKVLEGFRAFGDEASHTVAVAGIPESQKRKQWDRYVRFALRYSAELYPSDLDDIVFDEKQIDFAPSNLMAKWGIPRGYLHIKNETSGVDTLHPLTELQNEVISYMQSGDKTAFARELDQAINAKPVEEQERRDARDIERKVPFNSVVSAISDLNIGVANQFSERHFISSFSHGNDIAYQLGETNGREKVQQRVTNALHETLEEERQSDARHSIYTLFGKYVVPPEEIRAQYKVMGNYVCFVEKGAPVEQMIPIRLSYLDYKYVQAFIRENGYASNEDLLTTFEDRRKLRDARERVNTKWKNVFGIPFTVRSTIGEEVPIYREPIPRASKNEIQGIESNATEYERSGRPYPWKDRTVEQWQKLTSQSEVERLIASALRQDGKEHIDRTLLNKWDLWNAVEAHDLSNINFDKTLEDTNHIDKSNEREKAIATIMDLFSNQHLSLFLLQMRYIRKNRIRSGSIMDIDSPIDKEAALELGIDEQEYFDVTSRYQELVLTMLNVTNGNSLYTSSNSSLDDSLRLNESVINFNWDGFSIDPAHTFARAATHARRYQYELYLQTPDASQIASTTTRSTGETISLKDSGADTEASAVENINVDSIIERTHSLLDPQDADIFLQHIQGVPTAEIALRTNMDVKIIRKSIIRSKQVLIRELGGQEPEKNPTVSGTVYYEVWNKLLEDKSYYYALLGTKGGILPQFIYDLFITALESDATDRAALIKDVAAKMEVKEATVRRNVSRAANILEGKEEYERLGLQHTRDEWINLRRVVLPAMEELQLAGVLTEQDVDLINLYYRPERQPTMSSIAQRLGLKPESGGVSRRVAALERRLMKYLNKY